MAPKRRFARSSAPARAGRVHALGLSLAVMVLLSVSAPLAFAVGAPGADDKTAADDPDARRAQDITRTTMSPFCPGRTLDACPSQYAAAWREDIRRWVSEGLSTEEIRERLHKRSDQDLSGAPSTQLDTVLPVMVTILAVLVLVLLLRALLRQSKADPAQTKRPEVRGVDAKALDDRLDAELRELDD